MEYTHIKRRGQRSIRLRIKDNGEVIVSSPYFITNKQIEDFIVSKSDWITLQKNKLVSHTYQQNDIMPYFGKNLHLNIIECMFDNIEVCDSTINVYTKKNTPDYIKRQLKTFYSEQLYEKCAPRVDFWAKQMLVRTPNLVVNNSKTRWGVCYPNENLIKISLISATLDSEMLDMIVLHETCHLVHCNHQKEFYNLMEKCMPDFKEKNTRFKRFAKTGVHRNLF